MDRFKLQYKHNFRQAKHNECRCSECFHLIEIKEGLVYACDAATEPPVNIMISGDPTRWTCDENYRKE